MIDREKWARILDRQYEGDPFKMLIECDGKRYVYDEAALIEQEEKMYREFEADMRRRMQRPW